MQVFDHIPSPTSPCQHRIDLFISVVEETFLCRRVLKETEQSWVIQCSMVGRVTLPIHGNKCSSLMSMRVCWVGRIVGRADPQLEE